MLLLCHTTGWRNVGKNLRMCSGSRGIRKWWAKAPGAPGKGPKNLYPSLRRHLAKHTLSYTFSKIKFSKKFWALSRGLRGFCPPFSNSPTPATHPQIFSDVSTSILASFFTALPNGLTARPCCAIPRGDQPMGPRHTWPVFFPPHHWKRWSLTSTVTPTPLLYSFFSFSPKSKTGYAEGHTTDVNICLCFSYVTQRDGIH